MTRDNEAGAQGGCYCGAVRYQVAGALRDVVNCHCGQCRKLNGNFGAHAKAPTAKLTITQDGGLAWFQISDSARRAFCRHCGSPLFWQADGQAGTGIVAGSLDDSRALRSLGHIFVDAKPPWTLIDDGLPQFGQSSAGAFPGDQV